MPVLKVYGIPDEMVDDLGALIKVLQEEISSIKELELKKTDISIFFPQDLAKDGLGEEIIVFVDGLFKRPKRTKVVMDLMAQNIVEIISRFVTEKTKLIECFVKSFDETKQGFYSR